MSFLDDLLGNTAADASKAAAADTYAKQQAATSTLQGQGQQYATAFGGLGQQLGGLGASYQPWINTGQTANSAVQQLMANPSSVSSLPGYQFQMDQGTKALDHSAVANGNLFSGAQGKALDTFGQNLANTTYNQQLQNLLGVSNQGLGAQGQQNQLQGQGLQMQGQGLTGQLGANQTAYGGNMQSAGTIGQGNIAAANAQAQGSQNLLNAGLKVAGMVAAPFTGGASLAGSGALSSLFGGGGGMSNYGQTSNATGYGGGTGGLSFPMFG